MDLSLDQAVEPRHCTGSGAGVDWRAPVRPADLLTLRPLLGKSLAHTLERHVDRRIPLWRNGPAERTFRSPVLRPPLLETGLAEAVAARQEDGFLEDVLANRTAQSLLEL